MVYVYNLQEDDRLLFTDYNRAADKILGINHAHLVNKEILEAFPNLAAPMCRLLTGKLHVKGSR